MRVCLYLEGEEWVAKSGFKTAFENHRRALQQAGIEVTVNPKDEYDLLHTHFFGPKSVFYIKQAKRKHIPVVCHAHSFGAHDFRDSFALSNAVAPLYDRYLRYIFNHADIVMTCSQYAKRVMEHSGITVPIEVVSNGMDTQHFRPDLQAQNRYRESLGLSSFTFFSAGNLIPRKGVADFMEVAKELSQYQFVWFGKRWNKLLNANHELGRVLSHPPNNVHLPGFVDDTASTFAAMNAFFFPSYTENQPMVILESATLGLPLIVRDIPEYKGFLTHDVNCLKAQSNAEFIKHLKLVAQDEQLHQRLSKGALALADVHGLPQVGRRLKSLYASLVEQKAMVAASA